jgi:DNA-directed RNA polymerase subunit RPC12/RpoP
MPNLPYVRCPNCGGALPIKVLWDFSRHSRFELIGQYGTLTGRIGIACPSCGIKLRIVQTRIRIFLVATSVALFATVAYLLRSMHVQHLSLNRLPEVLGLMLGSFALYLLQRALIPHLTQVRPAQPDEHLGYPLSSAFEGPAESLLDAADSASNNRWRGP